MLARVVGELDDQQVLGLGATADGVCAGDVGAVGGGALERVEQLCVRVVDKLQDGGRLLGGHTRRQHLGGLLSCRENKGPQGEAFSYRNPERTLTTGTLREL